MIGLQPDSGGGGGDFSATSLPEPVAETGGSEDGSDGGGTTWSRGNFTSPDPENGSDLADQSDNAEETNTRSQFSRINDRLRADRNYGGSAPGVDRGDNDSPQTTDADSPGDMPGGHNNPYITDGNTDEADTEEFNDTIDLGHSREGGGGRQTFDFENNALGVVDNPFGDSGFVAGTQEQANDITTTVGDIASRFDLGGETENDWDNDGQTDNDGETGNPDNSADAPEDIPQEIVNFVGPWGGQNEQESPNFTNLIPTGTVALAAGVGLVAVIAVIVL